VKVSADGDYLAVMAPAGRGSVFVTVTSPQGTSLIAQDAKYHFIKREPIVTAISPTSGSPNGGTGVLIGGKYLNGALSVSFGGTSVKPLRVSSNGEFLAVKAPPGVGTVEVIVTTPSGTSADTSDDQYTYNGA
jgi:large repetitive protein